MAVVGAIGLAAGLAQTLCSALQTDELKDICSSFSYETELEMLKNTMQNINAILLDVDAKRHGLTHENQVWIENLKDAVYDVDDLLDEFRTNCQLHKQTQDVDFRKMVGNFFSRNNKYFVAINLSQNMKMLRESLDVITIDHTDFDFTHVTKPVVVQEETCSVISELEVIEREEDKETIVGILLSDSTNSDPNVTYVNIVGIGGSGKTTLAQLVYNDQRVTDTFSKRIWVCVSEQYAPEVILGKILGKEVFNLEVAQQEVRNLLEGERYLLVLDNVRNESHEEWHSLKCHLDSGVSGSKVIITTRSKKVARATREDSITHELQHLSEENSWSLFELIAFGKKGDHQVDLDLVEIGRDIVKKCANVPLSIKVIASLLHGQNKIMWERFLSNDMSNEDDENCIMQTLMFSYYHLTPKLKSCFSFCSLFPKDHVIKKELLINLWSAQGFLDSTDNAQSIEDVGERYITILLNRYFFQDIERDDHGDVVSFKMHDLMHDLALEVAGNESLIMAPTTKIPLGKNIRHLSREKGSSDLHVSDKLRSYVWLGDDDYYDCFSNYYAEDSLSDEVTPIVSKCKHLRVLSLPKFGIGCTLQDKIGKLLHLRYLDLTRNRLEMLPKSITKLHNLQVLILQICKDLKELPEDMSKLVNLRTLDISHCNKLTYMPKEMRNLRNLQRLSDFVVGGVDVKQLEGSKLEDLQAPLRSLKGNLCIRVLNFSSQNMPHAAKRAFILKNACLKSLRIKCGRSYKEFDYEECDDEVNGFDQSEVHETLLEDLCPNEDICKIEMDGYKGTEMPKWASLMEYSDMNGLQHVMSLSRFRCLKELKLYDLSNVQYMEIKDDAAWESRTLFFPVLEKLVLEKMPKLKGWWRGLRWREMEAGDGGCLVDANGHDIHMEHGVGLSCFPQLCELDITDCKSMKYFPPCPHVKQLKLRGVYEALTFCMKGGVSSSSVSTSSSCLEELGVDNARVINTVLLSEFAKGGATDIKLIGDQEVKSMGALREVFEKVGYRLNSLVICYCEELEIEHEEEEGMPWKYLQSLSSLSLDELPKMVNLPKGIQHLTSLQYLEIRECFNLEEIGECIGFLTSLQSLQLMFCKKIKALPECIRFLTSLWYLEIGGCDPLLESLPESMCHLTSLTTLAIYTDNNDFYERCQEPDGEYWPKIRHIPGLKITRFGTSD